ncbi:MAG: hypothetical protein JWQ90_2427 [Hydrocarboniphaga sp.]|uniref:acyl-CoA dehydrogenase C-terminal domain-containing protein n=1 Tax=Hydrocarboniphaga sp. TaxID=2033016 RepID=UPI002638A645|nr:acyl-CoA dehydrogenase C-terminal domain-containing protein [Hydrocarboniphaga sp.]MDB5969977.1 hypothetical protein [Hydrocarboniphaga sp.]
MHNYRAPIRDVLFSLNELHRYPEHYAALNAGVGGDEMSLILGEIGKFAERTLAPINAGGDAGARWTDGAVSAPEGFKDAYRQYVDAGWPRLGHDEKHGGQTVPYSLKQAASEFLQSANHAWCMYAALNDGAIKTLTHHARPEQVEAFVPRLVSGEWIGTMCLTEPQCGSDLNLVNTRAQAIGDGRYRISGTKIFISSGEQDLSENIVHLVLARLPDAPKGTRGISLFVVPKRKLDSAERNGVSCISIEHKMGIKGSATCVMAFDEAEGWLVGEPNRGLNCMFVYINKSRLGVAQQSQGHAEASFQATLAYARDRLQGRAPGGAISPDKAADPLIAQPDIRRMLFTQKAIAEGGRSLVHLCAKWVDLADAPDAAVRRQAEHRLALLIPIAKGALSELASEATDLGVQVLGGHGYMQEWGVEQRVRDVRVARIYEGTTGIQGSDLLGRKVLGAERETLDEFAREILQACRLPSRPELLALQLRLQPAVEMWLAVSDELAAGSPADPSLVGAAAVDYLMLSGYVVLGYVWLQSASVAASALAAGTQEEGFYRAKLQTARFYFDKLLPRASAHRESIASGSAALMQLDEASFSFA